MSYSKGFKVRMQNEGPGGQSSTATYEKTSAGRDGFANVQARSKVSYANAATKATVLVYSPSQLRNPSVWNRSNAAPPGPHARQRQQQSTVQRASLAPTEMGNSVMQPAYYGKSVFDQHPKAENWVHGYVIKEHFLEGTVVLAPYLEPLYNSKIQPGDGDRAETQIGAACAKHRPFILLSKCAEHFEAVPLYTYQSQGIKNKSIAMQAEHVSVARQGYPCHKQGPHEPLLLEHNLLWQVKETCVAHFTEIVSFSYSCPVKDLGMITRESYIQLAEMHLRNVHESIDKKVSDMKRELQTEKMYAARSQAPRGLGDRPGASVHRLAEIVSYN